MENAINWVKPRFDTASENSARMITSVKVELSAQGTDAVLIIARCKLSGQTGVEMEALTAASVAALTIYDMCKAVDLKGPPAQLRQTRAARITLAAGIRLAPQPGTVGKQRHRIAHLQANRCRSLVAPGVRGGEQAGCQPLA